MVRTAHSTVADVDGLSYSTQVTLATNVALFGWWIYARIPLTVVVDGTTHNTDWHDYRVRAAAHPSGDFPRDYTAWQSIGADSSYRYARIMPNHGYGGFRYQAQADLNRIIWHRIPRHNPDAAQITGGTLPAGRYSSSAAIRTNLGLGSAAVESVGTSSGRPGDSSGSGGMFAKGRLPSDTLYAVINRRIRLDRRRIGKQPALGVSVNEIIEELTERIQYYTTRTDYPGAGSTPGNVYTTSPYQKTIYKITALIDPPSGTHNYVARIFEINSGRVIQAALGNSDATTVNSHTTHSFNFSTPVTLSGSERVAVCVSRTGAGNGADALLRVGPVNGTFETYGDASNDFDFQGELVYSQENPAVGNGSSQNGTWVRGDIQIYYRITYDHGHIVGTREFAELSAANTFTAGQTIDVDGTALTVDARGYSGSNELASIRGGTQGSNMPLLTMYRGTHANPLMEFNAHAGGSGKAGWEVGPGGSTAPDVVLYRNAANVLKTPDTLDVGALQITGSAIGFSNLSGAAATTQIPNLAASKVTSGQFNTARLGTGTADSSKFLRGDGTWEGVEVIESIQRGYVKYAFDSSDGVGATTTVSLSTSVTLSKSVLFYERSFASTGQDQPTAELTGPLTITITNRGRPGPSEGLSELVGKSWSTNNGQEISEDDWKRGGRIL